MGRSVLSGVARAAARRGAWALAAVLLAAMAAGAASAGTVKTWPRIAGWETNMDVGDKGVAACFSTYGPKTQADGRRFQLLFMMSQTGPSFLILADIGPPRAAPDRLRFVINGAPAGELKVARTVPSSVGPTYMARLDDLPAPGKFIDKLLEASGDLKVIAGAGTYVVPLEGYSQAFGQLMDCTHEFSAPAASVAAAPPKSLAPAPPPPVRLSANAVRGVEPVDATNVAVAVTDFLGVHDKTGMIGAIDRSETCFTQFARTPSWKKADACLAFDEAASVVDAAMSEDMGVEPNEYFSRKVLDARTADTLRRLGGDHYVQDAHLKTLRMASKGALEGALKADDEVAGKDKAPAAPSREARLKGRFPQGEDADAGEGATDADSDDDTPPPGFMLGMQAFFKTWNTKDFDAVEAVSRACYAHLDPQPHWGDAEPCISLDETAWNMADGKQRFYKGRVPAYFTRAAVSRRQSALAVRTIEAKGEDMDQILGAIRNAVLAMLKKVADTADDGAGAGD